MLAFVKSDLQGGGRGATGKRCPQVGWQHSISLERQRPSVETPAGKDSHSPFQWFQYKYCQWFQYKYFGSWGIILEYLKFQSSIFSRTNESQKARKNKFYSCMHWPPFRNRSFTTGWSLTVGLISQVILYCSLINVLINRVYLFSQQVFLLILLISIRR